MRRTRHVVLPVRSWEHVGLMVVSLACLTLGLVSRDREGQAGSLAGPDLQHCAPHKVDACPNEDVFTRLLFYDDMATLSVKIPIDQTEDYQTTRTSKARASVNRENRFRRDNRDARFTPRATAVRTDRSEDRRSAERRDARLSELRDDRRSRQTRDSRSLGRDFEARNYRASSERRNAYLAERRNEQRSQAIRMIRSLERDSFNKNSRSVADRQIERQTDRLRSLDRDSAARKYQLTVDRRDARVSERRIQREQVPRLSKRDSSSRKSGLLIVRSAERKSKETSERRERDISTRTSRLASERRDDERSREIRGDRSLDRESAVRNLRVTSERRSRNTRSIDREASVNQNARLFVDRRSEGRDFYPSNSRLTAEHRDKRLRLSQKIQGLRSTDRDSEIRNARIPIERRDARSSERRDERRTERARLTPILSRSSVLKNSRSASDREIERRDARLSVRRDDRRERREIRDSRSYQRNTAIRNSRDVRSLEREPLTRSSRLVVERRDDRLNRQFQRIRSLDRDTAAANSRLVTERRDVRSSGRQDDRRTQQARHAPIFSRNSALKDSRSEMDRETERRDNRLSIRRNDFQERRKVRVARSHERDNVIRNLHDFRSLERDFTTRRTHLVAERRDERWHQQIRGSRSLDHGSRARSFELTGERRDDSRLAERRVELQSRRFRESRSIRQSSSSGNLYLTTERRDDRVNDQIRNSRSAERDLSVRDGRSVGEARGDRLIRRVRSVRSTERTSLINHEREWINSLRNSRNVRKELITRKTNNGENRADRESRTRRATDLRKALIRNRENLIQDEKVAGERMMRERTLGRERDRDVRADDRTRGIRVPVSQKLRENNYEIRGKRLPQGSRLISANILPEQLLPIFPTYQGLEQTAILILCAIYGASLYGGKSSIPRNIITYIHRFVTW